MRHVVASLLLAATVVGQSAERQLFGVDQATYLAHVRTLSSDELGGRGNGTPGLQAIDASPSRSPHDSPPRSGEVLDLLALGLWSSVVGLE